MDDAFGGPGRPATGSTTGADPTSGAGTAAGTAPIPGTGATINAHGQPWTSAWAQLDGPVHYADFGGQGPVVVCVHGLGGSYANWIGLAPLLARRARVLAVDLAGHGRTPAAGRRTDVRANQRLLDRFLAEVVAAPVLLVGNSMGGMISVMQAHAHPDTVAGLVLLDPALPRPRGVRPDPEITRLFAGLLLPRVAEFVLARRRSRYTPEQIVAETIARCTYDAERVPADLMAAQADVFRERIRQPDADRALVGAARSVVYALARPAQLAAMVRTVRQPTLLVHGAADRLVPVAVARHVAAQRPDWRVEILDDVGHVPQMEDAATTAQLVTDWFALDSQPAVRAARHVAEDAALGTSTGVGPTSASATDWTSSEPRTANQAPTGRPPDEPAAAEPQPEGQLVGADDEESDVSVIAPAIVRPEVAEIGHPPRGNSNGSVH